MSAICVDIQKDATQVMFHGDASEELNCGDASEELNCKNIGNERTGLVLQYLLHVASEDGNGINIATALNTASEETTLVVKLSLIVTDGTATMTRCGRELCDARKAAHWSIKMNNLLTSQQEAFFSINCHDSIIFSDYRQKATCICL